MLYRLVRKIRGKNTVIMRGELQQVRARMKALRDSQRGGYGRSRDRAEYRVEPDFGTVGTRPKRG